LERPLHGYYMEAEAGAQSSPFLPFTPVAAKAGR
jgi:hypothetical protein